MPLRWTIQRIQEKKMTINIALNTIYNHADYTPDDVEWQRAFNEITEALGVYYDKRSGNFVTKDTGDVI